jgi:cupin 2 domain-containing protein
MRPANLFSDATPPETGERFDTILSHRNLVIERIVSSSNTTPQEYVQAQDEWVVLLQGEALLQVGDTPVHLKAGEHLFLPAGQPHTVQHSSEGAIWLAVHLYPEAYRDG